MSPLDLDELEDADLRRHEFLQLYKMVQKVFVSNVYRIIFYNTVYL